MLRTLAATWDGASAEMLARRCGVPRIELLAETDSTQDVAHALAEQGAPPGVTVLADAQRAGRGRMGRTWSSEPGLGIWCTVLERPPAKALDVLSLRAGLYCAEALDAFADFSVGVKWPNDLVLLRDLQFGKLGGVLVEARWVGASLEWAAIGVGVNVVAPPGVTGAAGLANGTARTDVLAVIIESVRSAAAASGPLNEDELRRYHVRDVLVGRRIRSPGSGIVTGVTATGALVVETSRGAEQYTAGTVELNGEDARS